MKESQGVHFGEGFRVVAVGEGIRIELSDCPGRAVLLRYDLIDRLKPGHVLKDARILILVSEPIMREVLAGLLTDAALTVTPSPDEAAMLVSRSRYDLVLLTDYTMPLRDVLSVVPAVHPYPAVLISSDPAESVGQCCDARNIHCVYAPFRAQDLRTALVEAMLKSPSLVAT